MTASDIKKLIESGIKDCEAFVEGDGSHFVARVVSDEFEGLSIINQHKLVYKSLGSSMESAIHALSIHTYTSGDWKTARKFQNL